MTPESSSMPQTRVRSLDLAMRRSTVSGVVSSLVQIGTRLITVPVALHHLGLGGYGIWSIVMATATYMRFGSVGVKSAFQKYVAEATGNGDYERASRLLSTGSAAMLVLSLAGLLPLACWSRAICAAAGVPPELLRSAAGSISLLALIMGLANVGAAYEAIIMGGHRVDLVRRFNTVLTILEAAFIIIVLNLGYGLLAMAAVMGASELVYIVCCYCASFRIVPQIRLGSRWVSRSVARELIRFAGTYQLVNVLEVLYGSIAPFMVLRAFGTEAAGVFAVVGRVVGAAGILHEAFLPPLLSSGTAVYASAASAKMKALVETAFKATFGLVLFPMGYVFFFGPVLAYAWTGEHNPAFRLAFRLLCLKAVFAGFARVAFVLYRVSGRVVLDTMRLVLCVLMTTATAIFARDLGFYGVLAGLTAAEFAGMVFMLCALARTVPAFRANMLLREGARWTSAAVLMLGAGAVASYIPLPTGTGPRLQAAIRVIGISLACSLAAWPALVRTASLNSEERLALTRAVLPFKQR